MRLVPKLLICLLQVLLIEPLVRCELFTALVHLEKLLNTEKLIVGSLQDYLTSEEQRLSQLRQMTKHYADLHSIASKDVDSYLANPINAYLLVKRLTTDWQLVEHLLSSDKKQIDVIQQNETFPSAEDLSGAAEALLRLQDTYKLDTSTLADGLILVRDLRGINKADSGVKPPETGMRLTANDCFELGRQAYLTKDYYHTVLWMQEALDRLDGEKETGLTDTDKATILEYLAFSTYQRGNIRQALKLTHQLLELYPAHPRAFGNVEWYMKELAQAKNNKKRGDDGDVPTDEAIIESQWSSQETEREAYEALCRGEKRLSARLESELVCFHLNTTQIPFLRLTRIKVEEAFKRPQIVIFYDILLDSEIEVVKTLAEPKLRRATVQNSVTGNLETAKYRISKSAWLTNREHQVVNRISQRVADITGLELSTAEELQVVNYGIGGHYEPHYDFARREEKNAFQSLGTGNRIATWLNYMSDVEAGGATVFPMLGVSVWPKKGSAAFWYNLYKSGDGDLLTRHAACPVLVGSKWVSNKWIHERGQEFKKPCGLRVNDYNLVQA